VLLGTMLGLEQDHAGALQEFLLAAAASPADAQPRYNASESLRHLGRPADAIEQLRDAVQRNPGEPLYAFKLRLARIEAGQEKDLEADIRQQLAVKPPAGDWILTAAAVSLRHGRFAEAAGLMSAARQVMQPALFFALIQDSLFAASKQRPELAPFYDVKFNPAAGETKKGP
jgi:tetratricopeptide (TPR) repeat protein